MSLSIGNELKDSFKPTANWINNNINWLSDIEEFYRERATIELEYANKLKLLTKKHFDKKAKISSIVSVGDEPKITPGSLECASLVLWTDVLTQTENIAKEKVQLSTELNSKVSDNVNSLKQKSARIHKKIEMIHEFLEHDKKKLEEEINKSKKHYDGLCQQTESVRSKTEKSPSSDKYSKRLAEKEVDMNVGKNEYLINLNIANRLKDKYYYQDIPEVLDYFQELNELRVAILNKLLKNASIIERNSNDRVKEKLHTIDGTIDQNDPKLDTAMFIKHNVSNWKEPQDFYFIPCDIWHDDESLVVKEPELTHLKRMLAQASSQISRLEDACLNTKQQLEESTVERKPNGAEAGVDYLALTLKFDASLYKSLQILEQFMKDDSSRVQCEVKIEVIQNYAGDRDLTYHEVKEKKKSRFGFLGGSKSSGTQAVTTDHNGDSGSEAQSIHTVKSGHSHGVSGIFNLRKGKTDSSLATSSGGGGGGLATGKALYDYAAQGDDEVSMQLGDMLVVLELDDGSGWTSVQLNGAQGLVPTSYLEIQQDSANVSRTSSSKPKRGPSVAPKRGARRVQYVEALYDYDADGEDEISIRAGDKIILLQDDTDGSGWTEGDLNGKKGMFPTSYVTKV